MKSDMMNETGIHITISKISIPSLGISGHLWGALARQGAGETQRRKKMREGLTLPMPLILSLCTLIMLFSLAWELLPHRLIDGFSCVRCPFDSRGYRFLVLMAVGRTQSSDFGGDCASDTVWTPTSPAW